MSRFQLLQEGLWRMGARGGILLMLAVAFACGYLFCMATTRPLAAPLYTTGTASCCSVTK